MRTSVRNASKLTLAMAITIPLGFVTRILIPRFLGSEQAGQFFFAESFPVMLLGFMTLGLPAYIQKTIPARHEHAREVFTSIFVLELGIGALLTAGLIGFMALTDYEPWLIGLTAVMACYQVLTIFATDILQRLLISVGQVNVVAALNVVSKTLVASLVLVCLVLGLGLYALAWAFLATALFVIVVLVRKARALGMTGGRSDVRALAKVLGASLPFFVGGVLASTHGSVDTALLSKLADFHEIGYYSAAMRLHGLFLMLIPIAQNALNPMLARAYEHDRAHYAELAAASVRALLIAAFPLSLAFTAFGREIILLVYGEDFRPAVLAITVCGPLLLFSYTAVFLAMNAIITTTGYGLAVTLAAGFGVNALMDWLLIPAGLRWLGAGGGAAGAMSATLCVEIVTSLLLVRVAKLQAFNERTFVTFLLAAAPSLLLVAFHGAWTEVALPARIGLVAVLGPAYVLLSRMTTKAELVQFVKTVRGGRAA